MPLLVATMTSEVIAEPNDGGDHQLIRTSEEVETMAAYAVGILRDVNMGPPIVEYLERIDATLAPYDGHFIVHGGRPSVLEGTSPGVLIVIEFPDRARAEGWYASPAYRDILPLRTENSTSTVFVIDGVDRDHRATDVLTAP
jgi:uncharacterized protein (DUF1330 family)